MYMYIHTILIAAFPTSKTHHLTTDLPNSFLLLNMIFSCFLFFFFLLLVAIFISFYCNLSKTDNHNLKKTTENQFENKSLIHDA